MDDTKVTLIYKCRRCEMKFKGEELPEEEVRRDYFQGTLSPKRHLHDCYPPATSIVDLIGWEGGTHWLQENAG